MISVSLEEMPPKLLTLRAPLHRDRRTLIWLQHQDPSITWSRWDAVVSSLADYHRWYDAESRLVGIVLMEGSDTDEFLEDLYSVSKDVPMILITRAILSIKSSEYWTDNFDNLLCLDDLLEQYPFLLSAWDGTVEDAIAIFALLCRYNRLVDVKETRLSLFRTHIQTVFGIVPESTWLITQFFVHPEKRRAKEIKECLVKNCASIYLDTIVLLNETDLSHLWKSIPGSHKIKQIIIGKRMSYYDVLTYISNSVPKQVIAIISNADIYVDSTLLNVWKINLADRMLALLRWEDNGGEPTLFGPRSDSQDTWIVLSDSIKTRTWSRDVFGFTFGQPGCDSAFAAHMLRQRFILFNPSLSIQTFHRHTSDIRDYSMKDTVSADLYVQLDPTHLLDTSQEKVPVTQPQCICNELVTFEVHSSSLSNEMTYCTMLAKDDRYKWEAAVENRYFEPAIPVYSWKNSCVTPNGLVYDAYTIYTGKYADDERFQYWKDAKVDIFTPLQKRHNMMAIPFADLSVFSHPTIYVLQYISRVIRMRALYPNTSFWIPVGYESCLKPFGLSCEDGVMLGNEMTGCWAEEVVGFLPGPLSVELGREDLRALRSQFSPWRPSPTKQLCVIVADDIITEQMIEDRVAPWLLSHDSDWNIRVATTSQSVVGASLCILMGGPHRASTWSTLWALPSDACVIEFQQELAIDGEFQHLCHVGDMKSWVLLLAKGSTKDVQDQIMEQLEKWYKKSSYELLLIQ